VLRSNMVRLAFTTPSRPALLLPVTGDEAGSAESDGAATEAPAYRYLVMPARLPG
jgi:DNA polymerase-3 subunit beta